MKSACLVFAFGTLFLSWDLGAAEDKGLMQRITAQLNPVLQKLEPKPAIGSSEQTLVVSYKAQPYKIQERLRTGEISGKVRDEIGPGPKGFVLRVDLQTKGEVKQAVTPQVLRETYWTTDLNVTPVGGGPYQIYWTLSYGEQTDSGLLSRIRSVLRQLAREPQP
jgi:hypothetical protein